MMSEKFAEGIDNNLLKMKFTAPKVKLNYFPMKLPFSCRILMTSCE